MGRDKERCAERQIYRDTQRDIERDRYTERCREVSWYKVKTQKGCRYGKKLNGQWMNLPDSELGRREA